MNRKLAQLIFTLIFTFALAGSAFAQAPPGDPPGNNLGWDARPCYWGDCWSEGGASGSMTANTTTTTATGTITIGNDAAFNNRVSNLNLILDRAQQTLGEERTLFLISAALGVRFEAVQNDFANSNLTMSQFLLAEIIAEQAIVPAGRIITEVNQTQNFAAIISEFNLSRRSLLMNFRLIAKVFNSELAANGTVMTQAEMNTLLDRQMRKLSLELARISILMGDTAFNNRLATQLALATGLSVQQVLDLRASLGPDLSASQFAIALIAANSLAVTNQMGMIDSSELANLTTAGGLSFALTARNIPAVLMAARLRLFLRGFDDVSTTM